MSTDTATDRPTLLPDLDEPALVWRAGLLDATTTVLAMNYLHGGTAGEANPLMSWFVMQLWRMSTEPSLGLYWGETLLATWGAKVTITLACVWLLRRGWGHVESVPYGPAYIRLLAYCYLAIGPLLNLWVLAK